MPRKRKMDGGENDENLADPGAPESGGESEDLFGDNYMDDYRTISELDTYDASDTLEEPLSYEEMQRIEHEISQNEKVAAGSGDTGPGRGAAGTQRGSERECDADSALQNREAVLTFVDFLNTFDSRKYVKLVRKMCADNHESLYVSYMDLESACPSLTESLLGHTEETLRALDAGLERMVRMHFPNYHMIRPKLHARLVGLPVFEDIRSLRNSHLNTLIRVNGIVTRRSNVLPLLSIVKFSCLKCGAVFGPFVVDEETFKPSHCTECQSRGPFTVNSSETVYKDYQKLMLQEIPGTVPPGSLPRTKEVLCYFDLIDKAKPGDEVEVVGVYKNSFSLSLNVKNGFPVFFTAIEALSIISKESEFSTLRISDDDIRKIRHMARSPRIVENICNSIAPSIYGFSDAKRAVALALFGGVRKVAKDHVTRGDINVLMLGDPGTAKSQILRYVQGIMHRAVLATGQGTSSVGLTASVQRDYVTKEWTLDGGALVLADRGVCLIDEFDKMIEIDRTSIHEAMEQQTVSISKAGIVTSLNARCGVIAAANPIRGRYNPALTFNQNVNLSDPIITRFDILCVVKDVIDTANDQRMAEFVLGSHSGRSAAPHQEGSAEDSAQMDQDMLRKYIIYARSNVHPVIQELDLEKISQLYSELRRESQDTGSVPITVRHIESMVRMSEAFARMRLSSVVSPEDIDSAITVTLNSFVGAQKYSVMKSLRRKFSRYLVRDEGTDVVLYILGEMFNEKLRWKGSERLCVLKNELENVAKGHGFRVSEDFYHHKKFLGGGYRLQGSRIFRASA